MRGSSIVAVLVVAVLASGTAWRARVRGDAAYVTLAVDGGSVRVGLVTRGALLEVEGCEDGGRARLPGGAELPCAVLEPSDAGPLGAFDPPLRWGSVRDGGASLRWRPRADAGVLEVLLPPHSVALIDDPELTRRGWGQRLQGGYVALHEVWLSRPSAFVGEPGPRLPLAFTLRPSQLAPPPGVEVPSQWLPRHARFPAQAWDERGVDVGEGLVPRADVRLVVAHPRPAQVPAGARWVHVELSQQALVAYEGDTPVYATLVSTGVKGAGAEDHRTDTGLFRVWLKSLHDRMHGEGYFVEEVPFILFFSGGQALHGAFWHDAFGGPVSHGCVNLSMADARWLFEWAPPELPPGWHSALPGPAGAQTLWVHVEQRRPPARGPPPPTDR